ncbi:microsomal signal peptidase 18 kDa subunit [Usnea florida]
MRATTPSSPNRTLSQFLIYLLLLTAPYIIWHFLCLTFHTSSPLVFVTSESMSPVYQRGDILFVSNRTPAIELGDVVVCWLEGRKLPFVHRVIEKHVLPARAAINQRYGFLTQGDNSPVDDDWLYPLGQHYLFRSDIIGTVKGHLPYIGQLALLSVDFPWLKQFLVGILALLFVRSFR